MALSLGTIFQPLNDFFVGLYGSPVGSSVMFRFDKYGSVISEKDFIDPRHPELGYSANLAEEKFSDLINYVPQDVGDGISLAFTADTVDTTYFYRLLSPAQPCVSGSDQTAQDIIAAFSTLKADALKQWTNLALESSSGLMMKFEASIPKPTNWYDTSAKDVWTDHSISITTPPAAAEPPPDLSPLWRLKLSDAAFQAVALPELVRASPVLAKAINTSMVAHHIDVANLNLANRDVQPVALRDARLTEREINMSPISGSVPHAMSMIHGSSIAAAIAVTGGPEVTASLVQPAMQEQSYTIHDSISQELTSVGIGDRFKYAQVVGLQEQTAAVITDAIDVSFAYSLVRIRRPWLIDSFLNDPSWYVPSLSQGAISTGSTGSSFSLLTIGFVTIKDLVIRANWAADDVANSNGATDFGPFKVEGGVVEGKLSHPGIQVVGWLVQALPDLPPNDPPSV